jgi:S-DNA-T family DNA segregation ATPase FtsK/SpoIIIE
MAYQTRGRDPLLDSSMQAAIERRGKELAGLGCLALAVMSGLMIGTYSPDDPNWLVATDAPVSNWMGRIGASLAHPLMMIVGLAAWAVPAMCAAWGVRLSLHLGEERVPGRMIFAPIAVAVAAVYCATLVPGADWPHGFGLGGLFGDTLLGVLLTALPVGTGAGLKLLSLGLALAALGVVAFVSGFSLREMGAIRRFLLIGVIQSFDLAMRALGRGAQVSMRAAQGMQGRLETGIAARRAARAVAAEAGPAMEPADVAGLSLRAEPPLVAPRQAGRAGGPVLRAQAVGAGPRDGQLRRPPGAEEPAAGQMVRMPPPVAGGQAPAMPPAVAAPARSGDSAGAGGFLSGLFRRLPPLVEEEPVVTEAAPQDRLSARISAAVQASRQAAAAQEAPVAPRERPRGPQPLILQTARSTALPHGRPAGPAPVADTFGRVEPPLRAPQAGPVTERPLGDHAAAWEDEDEADRDAATAARAWSEPLDGDEDEDEEAVPVAAGGLRPRVPVAEPRRPVVQHGARRAQPSTRARAEAQPALPLEDPYADYEFPPLSLLTNPADVTRHHLSDEALEENARMLESVLDDYGVKGEIVAVRPGPVVTLYELEPAPGLKASRVIGLADDIARSMSALSARVSTVPGRSVIGIELPNANREKVVLREILSARDFGDSQMRLPLALGKDISGEPVVANLAKMPHLLIAGTTGSGKSVAINTMILSLLYKLTPEECRLIMIDPKMLELSVYDGIPHLLSPVVTDPKKAVAALKWVVSEMEERYRRMSKMGVRNIEGYNGRVREALAKGETFSRTIQTGFDEETGDPIFETEEMMPEVLPYIVVIVDEMADLMMVAGKEIEACIQRLAQMARASGIHLIMATQRPSVDVITGTIKANFPTRISFQVTSKIDSRTILGEMGAEQLLGMGDMLYMAGGGRITRIHGPFCSDEEVEEVVSFLKGYGPPEYVAGVVDGPDEETAAAVELVLGLGGGVESDEALYDMAVQIVARDRKCSTSYIQRKLAIGYNKAARLVEQMEDQGVVSPANAVGKREILVPEPH